MKLIAYLRVSTAKQGQSGLGLDAQAAAIRAYAERTGGQVLATFTEVETGKANDRPELAKALHLAKVTGATLVIAKLDRLSRNAAFLLTLRDSGVRFVAADMPDANELTVGVMALIAQHEREAIAKRTREALQAARARGRVLGNPKEAGGPQEGREGEPRGSPGRGGQGANPCRKPRPRDRRPAGRGSHQPRPDRGRAECPRHAHPAGWALAPVLGSQPAGPPVGPRRHWRRRVRAWQMTAR